MECSFGASSSNVVRLRDQTEVIKLHWRRLQAECDRRERRLLKRRLRRLVILAQIACLALGGIVVYSSLKLKQ